MHALLPIPQPTPRFVQLPRTTEGGREAQRFIRIETLIGMFLGRLFPGFIAKSQGAFRVLRDSDIEVQEEAEDLTRAFEAQLRRRRRGNVIRLEIDARCRSGCSASWSRNSRSREDACS